MAVESMLAADLIMNFSILCAVQLSLGRLHLPSVIRALALMCANTACFRLAGPPFQAMVPLQGIVCLLCAAILLRERRPVRILTASVAIICATAAAAGFAGLIPRLFLPAGISGCALFVLLVRRRRNPAFQWNIEIAVEKNGVVERFTALIDTGNRLTEHQSALPVLIVEEQAAPRIAELINAHEFAEVRMLPFGVLGSSGCLPCFRPDNIHILSPDGCELPAPDCWIGVFPGTIPGPTQALAPPEFAAYTCRPHLFSTPIPDTIRRISHAIFNRPAIHLWSRGSNQARFRLLHRRQ